MGVTDSRRVDATAQASANVHVAEYGLDDLRTAAAVFGRSYDAMDDREKVGLTRLISAERAQSVRNTTCIGLDEYRAQNLCVTETDNETIEELAVGRDNGTTPAYKNRSLNDAIGRIETATQEVSGTTVTAVTLIDAGEMNGESLSEVGLYSSGGRLLNHSLINPISKDDQKSVTVEVRLTFDTA